MATDPLDGFLVSCPDACTVSSALSFPPGMDFDVRVYDATNDPAVTRPAGGVRVADEQPGARRDHRGAAGTLLYFEAIAVHGQRRVDAHPRGQRGGPRGVEDARRDARPAAARPRGRRGSSRGPTSWPTAGRAARWCRARCSSASRSAVETSASLRAAGQARRRRSTTGGAARSSACGSTVPARFDAWTGRATRWRGPRRSGRRRGCATRSPTTSAARTPSRTTPTTTSSGTTSCMHLPEAWDVTVGLVVGDRRGHRHGPARSTPTSSGGSAAGYDFISSVSNAGDGNGQDPDPTDPGDEANPGRDQQLPRHARGRHHRRGDRQRAGRRRRHVALGDHAPARARAAGRHDRATSPTPIRYAARLPNGTGALPSERAHVINMSLGGAGFTTTMQDAIDARAGRGRRRSSRRRGTRRRPAPSYPAAHSGVISISAVDLNGNLAPYSNYGSTIDLAAPGGDLSVDRDGDGYPDGVLSTLYDDSVSPAEPVYAFYQGTSMACPHAAGVAALDAGRRIPTLTPADIETILANTADDRGPVGRDDSYGHGLIDAHAAVLAAQGVAYRHARAAALPHLAQLRRHADGPDVDGLERRRRLPLGLEPRRVHAVGRAVARRPSCSAPATRRATCSGSACPSTGRGSPTAGTRAACRSSPSGGTQTLQVLMTVGAATPVRARRDALRARHRRDDLRDGRGDRAAAGRRASTSRSPRCRPASTSSRRAPISTTTASSATRASGAGCTRWKASPCPWCSPAGDVRGGVDFVVTPDDAIPAEPGEHGRGAVSRLRLPPPAVAVADHPPRRIDCPAHGPAARRGGRGGTQPGRALRGARGGGRDDEPDHAEELRPGRLARGHGAHAPRS